MPPTISTTRAPDNPIIRERQAKALHHLSRQWLKHKTIDDQSNGGCVVDEEGKITPA